MYQYLERKEFGSAYTTGCLGVTESDWRSLGREALDAMDLDVATKAYTRLKARFFLSALYALGDLGAHIVFCAVPPYSMLRPCYR
jgi:intraflagellar transport protein 122